MASANIINKADALYVEGELSFATVNDILKQSLPLLKKGGLQNIDLSNVSYMDSAGLALLCEWKRRLRGIKFHHIPVQITGMITLSGLETILSDSNK